MQKITERLLLEKNKRTKMFESWSVMVRKSLANGNCQQTGRQINVATKQDKAFPRGGCNPRKLLLTSDHPAH